MGNDKKSGDNAALVSAICGIIGSTIGKAFSHPIDTVKARLQVIEGTTVNQSKGSMIINTAQEVLKNEGVKGLYKGLPTALIGGVPASFLYFGSYEFWKGHTLGIQFFKDHSFISYLSAGIFAETIA